MLPAGDEDYNASVDDDAIDSATVPVARRTKTRRSLNVSVSIPDPFPEVYLKLRPQMSYMRIPVRQRTAQRERASSTKSRIASTP